MRWRVGSLSSLLLSSSSSLKTSAVNQGAHRRELFEVFSTEVMELAKDKSSKVKPPFIAFVLGGPGSGKGTQCTKIVETFGFKHLSAGDLLRREISSNSKHGTMILNTIREGKIVPSAVTVKLIQKEIESNEGHKFLIDGFPRTEENRVAFEKNIGTEPNIVLFFDCPEDEMVRRVLSRNQGRVDDNVETVKKRLKVFAGLNLPVIKYYSERGKLHKIDGVGTTDEIFERVRPVFALYEFPTILPTHLDQYIDAKRSSISWLVYHGRELLVDVQRQKRNKEAIK